MAKDFELTSPTGNSGSKVQRPRGKRKHVSYVGPELTLVSNKPTQEKPRPRPSKQGVKPGSHDSAICFVPNEKQLWAGSRQSSLPTLLYRLFREGQKHHQFATEVGAGIDYMEIHVLFCWRRSQSYPGTISLAHTSNNRSIVDFEVANGYVIHWDTRIGLHDLWEWLNKRQYDRIESRRMPSIAGLLEEAGATTDEILELSPDQCANLLECLELIGPYNFTRLVKASTAEEVAAMSKDCRVLAVRELEGMDF